jgi:outer membrane protein assembly factor BamB
MVVAQAPWLTASEPVRPWGNSGSDSLQPMATTTYPWPMYTYNETHSSLTKSPSPDDERVFWYNSTGPNMYGSPTIAEGKVFIGMGSPSGDSMLAFHINNGTLAWRMRTDAQVSSNTGVSATPAYSNGLLFFGADKLYALHANNGTVKWRFTVPNTLWGSGTPAVAQGMVFIGGADRRLHALNQNTGSEVWYFQTQSAHPDGTNYGLYGAPAICNGYAYLAAPDGYVYKISLAQSGAAVASATSARYKSMYGSPVIYDGKVYIGDGYTFTTTAAKFRALSANDLSQIWAFPPSGSQSFFSSAAVAYGKVFVGSVDDNLYALDAQTGAVVWNYATGGDIWSSPAISDGKVFIGSKSNYLYSFNANQTNPAAYRWQAPLYGDVDSSPAISDGRVCVGTWGNGGRIYCFGSGTAPPVNNPPSISLTNPSGAQDWTGGSSQMITWTMSDDTTPPGSLRIYLNYTSTPSSGTIAGPLAGATIYGWTVPTIDATDVRINATVIDANGLKGYSTVLVPQIDSTWPFVVSASPTGTGVALTAPIVVQFSERMDTASVESAFTLVPNMGTLIFSWSQRIFPDDTLTIDHVDFSYSTTYTATVWTGARDVSNPGNSMILDYIWSFTTIVNTPPTIGITAPAGGESWTGGTIHNIDWTAYDAEDSIGNLKVWVNYSVTGAGPFDHQIAGLQGVAGDARPYAWTVPFEDSTAVVLQAVVVDTIGGTGYGYSPALEIDSTPPIVSSTSPFSGETGVPTSANVQAAWSEPMMRTSAESAFSLKDTATWTPVAGTLSWAGSIMTFGPTSVLASGTQYSANFTTSARDASDPGNNLATPYSWTFTTASFVDVERPTLTSATAIPDPQEVYFPVNVSAVIRDNVAVGQVWLNVTNPAAGTINSTMSYDPFGMRYFLERNCGMLGLHTFVIWASDTSGNRNSTSGQFTCEDTTRPSISDLRAVPNPVEVFASTNLSALVSDNYLLSEVWVEVTAPDLTRTNRSMIAGPRYSRETIPDQLGAYIFKVSAKDSVDLWAVAVSTFDVEDNTPPLIVNLAATPSPVALLSSTNITADVTDNYLLAGVWVEITAPGQTPENQSMDGGPTFYYEYAVNLVGAYQYKVSAVDSSGNWETNTGIFQTTESVPPSIEHTPRATWPVTVALNITANVTDNILVQEVKLDYTDVDGVRRNVSMAVVTADEYSYEVAGQPHAGSISYYIWAVDGSLNGVRSQTYTTSIIERVPNPPAGLTVVPEGFGALRLSWAAPSLNTDSSPLTDLRGYNVYRMTQPNGQRTKVNGPLVTVTTFLDDNVGLGLADGTIYYYNVTAVNSRGIESAPAQEDGTTLSRSSGTDTSVILIAVAIIIVIIMAVILLLMKRRKRKESEQQQELAERKAPPPPPDDG